MAKPEGDWDFHLRSLSANGRDSSSAGDLASDPYILQSKVGSEELVSRAYPQINKLFLRAVSALPQSQTSKRLLLLTILQFLLDFGEVILHDADSSLRTFFRSCLSREFADPIVAEVTLDFCNLNKSKLFSSFPTLLPQVQKRFLDFMLAAFQRSPQFIALLKKPIVDILVEAYDSPAKSWHYTCVGLLGSMELEEYLTRM